MTELTLLHAQGTRHPSVLHKNLEDPSCLLGSSLPELERLQKLLTNTVPSGGKRVAELWTLRVMIFHKLPPPRRWIWGEVWRLQRGKQNLAKKETKAPGPSSLSLFQRRDYGSRIHLLGQEESSCPAFREKGSLQGPY